MCSIRGPLTEISCELIHFAKDNTMCRNFDLGFSDRNFVVYYWLRISTLKFWMRSEDLKGLNTFRQCWETQSVGTEKNGNCLVSESIQKINVMWDDLFSYISAENRRILILNNLTAPITDTIQSKWKWNKQQIFQKPLFIFKPASKFHLWSRYNENSFSPALG